MKVASKLRVSSLLYRMCAIAPTCRRMAILILRAHVRLTFTVLMMLWVCLADYYAFNKCLESGSKKWAATRDLE